MTEQEIRALLAVAVAYDNRRPTAANITAWWEQAERCRWSFDEAREAIHIHHAESSDYLMPAHVTTIIRRQRQVPGRYVAQLAPAAPASPDRIGRIMAALGSKLRWNRDTGQHNDDPALRVECPHCHAGPNRPCSRLVTRGPHRGEHRPLGQPHPSRVELTDSAPS